LAMSRKNSPEAGGYDVLFLDTLGTQQQAEARKQVRELQATMALPIYRRFQDNRRHGALRSNLWDDLCELPGRLVSREGRGVVALFEGTVVGFIKPPIRVPRRLCRALCRTFLRASGFRTELLAALRPGVEVWCANSIGVDRRHQGRGLPRRLVTL